MARAIDLARTAVLALEARVLLLESQLSEKNDLIRSLLGPEAEVHGLLVSRCAGAQGCRLAGVRLTPELTGHCAWLF